MSSTGGYHILTKYLSEEQRSQLVRDLVKDFGNEQNISGLVEILDFLDSNSKELVSKELLAYIKDFVISNEELEKLEKILPLIIKIPGASWDLLNWVHSSIISTISSRLNYLYDASALEVFKEHKINLTSVETTEINLDYLLSLLEKVLALEILEVPHDLDTSILVLLAINEETISTKASKILRWRTISFIENENLIWDLVFNLLKSPNVFHVTNGFIQWLRFLIGLNQDKIETASFISLIEEDLYWSLIQNGLISSTHEQKKYALSILKLSIQLTTFDLDNSLITFDSSKTKENVEYWKRFCTLYEILGVDTALNQAEAAKYDILEMLSPTSYIKPSWTMALLSTGFKANMESVRKFALNLMYAVPAENLSIFGHEFFTSVFLRYAIEASHFQVKTVDDKYVCEYGEKLESFVKNVLLSLRKDEDRYVQLIDGLLEILVDSTAFFAPARIYLTSGIIKGLKNKKVLHHKHLESIYKLFNSTGEDRAFETYLQSLHISFLKHFKPNQIELLLDALNQFVLFNGYSIFYENVESFLDYIAAYHDKQTVSIDYKRKGLEYQVIYFALFEEFDANSDAFLKELAKSGFNQVQNTHLSSRYTDLLTRMVREPKGVNYQNASSIVDLSIFTNSWSNIDLNGLYSSLLEDEFNQDKLDFFDKVYLKHIESDYLDKKLEVSFEDLLKLFVDTELVDAPLRVKDSIIASYLSIVLSFLKVTPLEDDQLDVLLSILQKSLRGAFFVAFIKISEIIQFLFSNYDQRVDLITSMEILEYIWDFVNGERLVLNQKDMHLAFIQTVFHPSLLKDSINNEYNARTLKRIGIEIVQSSFTRRSFLPCLSKCLLQYSLGYRSEFEQTEWIIELLYRILIIVQDDSNLFKIKSLICEKFDNEIAFEEGLYQKSFGDEEVSAKINIISILSLSSCAFSTKYFNELVSGDRYNLVYPKKRIESVEELQRLQGFASLLLISKQIPAEILSKHVTEMFLASLEQESSPLVRSYIEWIIAIDIVQSQVNRQALLDKFQEHNKPSLVTSVERIAFLVSQKLKNDESGIKFFESFTRYLIPNCASNKPLIRHFSNSLCLSLYPELQSKKITLPIDSVLLKLYEDAKKSESTGRFRSGDALTWDVEKDFTLTSIFGGVLRRISPREISMAISEDELKKYLHSDVDVEVGHFQSPWSSEEVNEESKESTSNSLLQTKSGAWETVLDLDEQQRVVKRTDLIVVSSLVDKPPNLGGICRLCDVLGTGLMTVDDLRVTKHPQFKNVAVTADYWMPMEEVKIENISSFMKQKKKEGYTLIGLEQTDKSIVLSPETKFPTKSLFLLGREAEGIPGELLSQLDFCIEIRQRGVIRSMNIQTATAVLVHAYSSSLP